MNDRPLILITNDDGVEAKGIKELTECLRDLGDIVVFAPDGPRSGMASAITSLVPIKYTLVKKEKGLTVYSCTGTPVDCVKLAINEVLGRKPDLLASGINHGGNHAICIQYSGTMGAAAEGCVFDVPSMGVSLFGPPCGCRLYRELPLRAHACTADHKRRVAAWHLSEPERPQCPERKRDEGMAGRRTDAGPMNSNGRKTQRANLCSGLPAHSRMPSRSMPTTTHWRSTAATLRLSLAR